MADVLVTVKSDPVAVGDDLGDQLLVGSRAGRDRKERGAGVGCAEHVEQSRSHVRIGAIIKRQRERHHEYSYPTDGHVQPPGDAGAKGAPLQQPVVLPARELCVTVIASARNAPPGVPAARVVET
jgi:hypothetical protein